MVGQELIREQTPEPENKQKIITPGQLVAKRFFRNKLVIVGIVILVFMTLFCFIGPFFSPYGEYELFYKDKDTGAEYRSGGLDAIGDAKVTVNSREPPSPRHILGTNQDGQDIMTRLMHGGRISLTIGFVCVFIELFLGVIMGGASGYYGKWADMLIMRVVDVFYCIPTIPVILILSSILLQYNVPNKYKIYILMLVIGLFGWSGVARMVRGVILSLREQEYMIAAEATGLKARNRIFRHLIPNVMPQLIVMATLGIGGVILLESALSYLGFGVQVPLASWGNMVGAVRAGEVMRNHPYIWLPPGICIFMTVMAFNFVGDGLRDAFDPKMRR